MIERSKKKHLVIATDCFLPRWDGVARFLSEVIPKLKETFDITIIAPRFHGSEECYEGVEIFRVPIFDFSIGDFSPARFKGKMISRIIKNADIVWSQTIGPIGGMAIYHANKQKKYSVGYVHSLEWELVSRSAFEKRLWRKISLKAVKSAARFFYNRCNLLMVPSLDIAKVLGYNGIKTKMAVIPLGVNTKKFAPAKHKRLAKDKIGLKGRYKVIGFCGRIGREKDLPTLYKAFKRFRKKHKETYLLIVGTGLMLESIFDDMENVIAVGSQSDVVKYYQAMDVFVLPSLTETSSLATMEAMSCGLPVITTKVGCLPEYIKNSMNGLFFEKKNSLHLEKQLERVFSDKLLKDSLETNSRKTIQSLFSWEVTIKKVKKILSSSNELS